MVIVMLTEMTINYENIQTKILIKDLIERLHLLFTHYTLEKLMYTNELEDFIGIKLTFSHIPEEYSFL